MSGCGVKHATNNITPHQHPIKNLIKKKKKKKQQNNELSVLMLATVMLSEAQRS